MERTLAAIMAGDVVGYSRLMADDDRGTFDRLRAGVGEAVLPSVAAHGGRVFDAETGIHLWSQRYDRTVADVFAVQTDVTRQIVASLVSYVRNTEVAATAGRPSGSLMAYELVLRGRSRYQRAKDDPAARQEAHELFA